MEPQRAAVDDAQSTIPVEELRHDDNSPEQDVLPSSAASSSSSSSDPVVCKKDESENSVDNELALQTIVAHLRRELDNVTDSYDEAIARLAELRTERAQLQAANCDSRDRVDMLNSRVAELDSQTEEERSKRMLAEAECEEQKETVSMLRQQLEESRKAIMRLQTESLHQSNNTRNKKNRPASLATGTSLLGIVPGERKTSISPAFARSISNPESHPATAPAGKDDDERRKARVQEAMLALDGSRPSPPDENRKQRRHFSAIGLGLPNFGQQQQSSSSARDPSRRPAQLILPLSLTPSSSFFHLHQQQSSPPTADELLSLKAEVSRLRLELSESNEARQASESCVKALRDFVLSTENDGAPADSLKGISLPPLPTDASEDDDEESDPPHSASRASAVSPTTTITDQRTKASKWSLISSLGLPRSPVTPTTPVPVSSQQQQRREGEQEDPSTLSSRALSFVGLVRNFSSSSSSSRVPSPATTTKEEEEEEEYDDEIPSLSDGTSTAPPSVFSSPRASKSELDSSFFMSDSEDVVDVVAQRSSSSSSCSSSPPLAARVHRKVDHFDAAPAVVDPAMEIYA
jgi:hypothetical protein